MWPVGEELEMLRPRPRIKSGAGYEASSMTGSCGREGQMIILVIRSF
jgi:hypothetical protein